MRNAQFSRSQIDASLLPRTYGASIGNRIFLTLVAGANAGGGLLGMIYFGMGHDMKSPGERLFFVLLSFFFVVLGSSTPVPAECLCVAAKRVSRRALVCCGRLPVGTRPALRNQLSLLPQAALALVSGKMSGASSCLS